MTIVRQELSKTDRPNYVGSKNFVPAFVVNKWWDPMRVLKCYLKRNMKFRNFGQESAKDSFCLSLVEPHRSVAAKTLSKWLVKIIKLAYEDSLLKGNTLHASYRTFLGII